ncbi:RcnB family protein [Sphingomonas sp.]|uniref:RcnB family protein n=1 Tax=Sphingomonas sp. TaxID=28214 RepID=UPI0035C7AF98
MSRIKAILTFSVITSALFASAAQARQGSISVRGPEGRGWSAERSVQAGPGGRSIDREITTNDGRQASISRDAYWGGGRYDARTTVTGPNGGTATREVSGDAWRAPPPAPVYRGARPGYHYAPGYGYYTVPPAYYGRTWAVGAVVPVGLRRYYVPVPAVYGLPPAPIGYNWIFAGNRVVLVVGHTGVVVRVGPVFW